VEKTGVCPHARVRDGDARTILRALATGFGSPLSTRRAGTKYVPRAGNQTRVLSVFKLFSLIFKIMFDYLFYSKYLFKYVKL
jgi:hypothetical protein